MIIVIYLIGFIIAYLLFKKMMKIQYPNKDRTWTDIVFTLVIASLSWVTIICGLLSILICKIAEISDNHKPPKWL